MFTISPSGHPKLAAFNSTDRYPNPGCDNLPFQPVTNQRKCLEEPNGPTVAAGVRQMLAGEPREGSGGRSISAIRAAALRSDRMLFLAARLDVVFKSKLIFRGGRELASDARPLFLAGRRLSAICPSRAGRPRPAPRCTPGLSAPSQSVYRQGPKRSRKTNFVITGCYNAAECRG